MAKQNKNWSREEHILAFNLYCKILFGQIHTHNPKIIELAKVLGRTPGSVSLKLSNFARHDPELQARNIKGMQHGAKGEIEIWHEFDDNPEALAVRLDAYHNETRPVIEIFQRKEYVATIDANQSVTEVYQEIRERLGIKS